MSRDFGEDHRLIREVIATSRKVGADKNFWETLSRNEELFAKVVELVGTAPRLAFTLITNIDHDMDGWVCINPVEVEEGEFAPFLYEFLYSGEKSIVGKDMIRRAEGQKIQTGLCHAEAMLRNQKKIPPELRKYCLVFPEVWQNSIGERYVFILSWTHGCWNLNCESLGQVFDFDCRFVTFS